MSDDPKRPKGTATMTLERDAAERAERLERERLASVERSAALAVDAERDRATIAAWQRIVFALVAVLAMLVSGVVAVGAGVEIPGVGSFSVSKEVEPQRAAPRVEAVNEATEVLDEEVAP